MTALNPFLRPQRVALVGASRNPAAISSRPGRFLRRLGFAGSVVAVHPVADEVDGYAAVRSLHDLSEPADVALLLVPADEVAKALDECASAGTHAAIVIASGFEGEPGRSRRQDVLQVLAHHPDLRMVGPNCNGVLSVAGRAPLCFSSVLQHDDPIEGKVSLVTQSGAIGNGLLFALQRRGVGLRSWFSTGDELGLGAIEIATALLDDDTTGVGLFLEGLTDAACLPALAAAMERTGKPVVALRAPQSAASRHAAFAHTGRLLGDDFLGRRVLLEHGVQLVDTLDELADTLTILAAMPRPPRWPIRVGVLTVSGGVGVFAAEAVSRTPGLTLAQFDETLRERLRSVLPVHLPIDNPLDVPLLGATRTFIEALTVLRTCGACDVVLVVAASIAHDYDQLVALGDSKGCPVAVTHLAPGEQFTPEQARRLVEAGGVSLSSATRAALALGLWGAGRAADVPEPGAAAAAPEHPGLAADKRGVMRSIDLLDKALVGRMPALTVVRSLADAQAAAARLGGEVVLKAEGSVLAHRTEHGAVATGLSVKRADAFTAAYERVAAVCADHGEKVILQAMAAPGVEVLVSVVRDAEIGPAVLVRPGGVLVDLVQETVALVGPRDRWCTTLLSARSLGPLLAGYRGRPPADVSALAALAGDLLDAVAAQPRLSLVECNPVLVHQTGKGVSVVDILTSVEPA